ncbi:TPA: hypothetical protein STX52_000594 [Clostridioides difficile]|nr:hypothetical protein [Clostridioides difficile]HBF2787047.1 hypothetical protein [Clostridioides difficile]HBF4061943.1 hypothetical protein [Clostridioides difficile]HBF6021742.1 hypothetical protein [Clostridioides difficile]HEK8843445.1 hypothetical protein [Clostridioides difficile]
MKSVIKKSIVTLLVTITSLAVSNTSYADEISIVNGMDSSKSIDVKAEQTRWYYRIHNGKKQKRLWSLTYGYWKTDWINL